MWDGQVEFKHSTVGEQTGTKRLDLFCVESQHDKTKYQEITVSKWVPFDESCQGMLLREHTRNDS